jgi:hypothetical protein
MKNVVKLLLPAITMTLLTACGTHEQVDGTVDSSAEVKQPGTDDPGAPPLTTTTCLWPSADNYTIDLVPHELPENEGDWEIDDFPAMIRSSATNNLPQRIHSIENEDFCQLQADSRAIIGQTGNCTTAIAAVRIWLGMDAGYVNIVPIYEPIALCHYSTTGQYAAFDVKAAATPTYYTYNGSAFTPVTGTAAANAYQQHVKLKRSTGAPFTSFNVNKDVRSLIYSFQEIGALIKDNNDNVVTVWNAVTKKPVSPGDSLHYHTLLLGPPEISPTKRFITSFNLKYANLAHLCPDNCVRVVFKSE